MNFTMEMDFINYLIETVGSVGVLSQISCFIIYPK